MPAFETSTDSLGSLRKYPKIHVSTGEESSGSGPDSTQGLSPRHRRERNPERPPRNSHRDWPFLRPPERVPEVPIPRIDSHHVCTWDSPVGKPRAKDSRENHRSFDLRGGLSDTAATALEERGKNFRRSRRISRGGALHRKGERNSRVVPPFQDSPRCVSPFQRNLFSLHCLDVQAEDRLPPRVHVGQPCGKASWESLVGKPRGKDSRENRRSFDPRGGLRETAVTALEESTSACQHSRRGLTSLGKLQKYPKIHVGTGEESSKSDPDSTQGLRPRHRREWNPERPPRNSHGDWPFLRPPERVQRSPSERIPGAPVASQEVALSTGKARGTPGSFHHSKSPPDVSVHSRGTSFPCTALTFKPRIDSHHVCTWDSPVGKPRGKHSRENHRSFDPRGGLRDTAATALEESASAWPHSGRGLTPLGRLQKYPKIHVSTGEESSGSVPDSTQGLRPRHRRERNPERPPRNSHGDWPFLRPPERVPEVPVGKNFRRSRRISRGGALHRKGERNSRVVPPFQDSPRCVSPFQRNLFSLHCLDVQAEDRLPPRVHVGQPCGKASWESLVGKPRGKDSRENRRSFDPRGGRRETAVTALEESTSACQHSRRGLTSLGKLQKYPKIHVGTGEESSSSDPDSTQGLRPRHRREWNPERPPRNSHGDWPFLRPPERVQRSPSRGLTPLGRLQKYPNIHDSTGEESSGSVPDSTQGLSPRHRRERNPERPPRNSHGNWSFLRPPERVPEVPVGKNSRHSRRISRSGALHRKGERNSRDVPPFQESPRCVSPFQRNLFVLHFLDVQAEDRLPPRVHVGQRCGKASWESLVGKTRGKAIDPLILAAKCMTLLLPLWRNAQVHARILDED
ncbi:hypothetical protein MJG53_000153 [Ovis ammon polii x Ovis aries]|nr:hypothetical protein MJG53_000153 [Ovis ammon polii x Ovis aries]